MRKAVNALIALLCSAYIVAAFALDVDISGTVTKKGGGPLEGATVSLAMVKGISATTDAEGKFTLKGSVGIMLQMNSPHVAPLEFKGTILMVSPASGTIHGTIDVYSGNGRKIASIHLSSILAEKQSLTLPAFRPGLNVVRVTLESERYTCRLVRVGRDLYIKNEDPRALGDAHFMLGKQASSVMDTLIVTKAGFNTKKAPIESYTLSGVAVTVDSSNTASDAKEASCTMALPTTKYTEWPSNAKFPDPFKMKDGTRMSKKSQWCEQRAYLSSLLQATSLGEKPPKPEKVTASFSNGKLTINCTVGSTTKSFSVTISNVPSGDGLFPAIIGLGGSMLLGNPNGVAKITYTHNTIAAQTNTSSRGKGLFYDLYGSSHSAGAMMAWAWGVSRILDGLELCPEAKINPYRCAITGCSRDGKGAMVCGAFDERIALTLAMEGGSGGISSWRIAKVENSNKSAHPDGCQTASQIIGENVWLSPNFTQFASGDINKLPTDAHTLAVMCAPRALFMIEGSQNSWNCNVCCWTAASAAKMLYEFLGFKTNIGIVMNDHSHCNMSNDYGAGEKDAWNAFCKRFLLGDETSSTDFFKNDGSFDKLIDLPKWIDWTAPTPETELPKPALDHE